MGQLYRLSAMQIQMQIQSGRPATEAAAQAHLAGCSGGPNERLMEPARPRQAGSGRSFASWRALAEGVARWLGRMLGATWMSPLSSPVPAPCRAGRAPARSGRDRRPPIDQSSARWSM